MEMRKVFLSFVEEDLRLFNLFSGLAKNQNNSLEFSNHSVKVPFNSQNAEYIRQEISKKINLVSVLVCLVGYTTHTSNWVAWEIETAKKLGKGIVGVRLHSNNRDVIPQVLQNSCHYIVDWNIIDIVDAIERAAKRAGY